MVDTTAETRRLWWYAAFFLLPVAMFAVAYPLPASSDQLVDIGKLAAYRADALVAYILGLSAMFVIYIAALRLCVSAAGRESARPVATAGVIAAAIMAMMYPVNAIDVFIYSVRSRIFTTYGQNPLAVTPSSFPDDPLMRFASAEWSVTVSPYGPLWNLIAAPITALAGDNLLAALLGFKTLAVAAVLGGGWLLARIAVAAGLPVAAAVVLYLWNPLVLWEGIGNGHNDTVMMVPVLAALLAWTTGRDRYVLPLLVVAVCIKYVAVLALPVAAVAIWRRQPNGRVRLRVFGVSAALSAAIVIVSCAPFFDVAAIWSSITQQGSIFLTSPAAVALTVLRDRLPEGAARPLVTTVGSALMAIALVIALVHVWRRPDRFPRGLYETMFVFLLIATWNFRVWYLIWLVALAATMAIGWPAWRAIAWTAGGLAGYVLFIWIWHWWPAEFPVIQAIGVAILTGPAVIVTLAELVQQGRRARHAPAPPAGS
jgi:hypothetical protein